MLSRLGIYFILLFCICLCSVFIKKHKIQSFIFSLLLLLILVLRDRTVGIDLEVYLSKIRIIKTLSYFDLFFYDMEYGYLFFNKLVLLISENERFFIFIYSLILIVLLKKFIDKNTKIVWLSYFLFVTFSFYTSFFVIIRQSFALMIILMSIKSIEERRLKDFFIYYFIAISFHYTAAIFIFLYIIYPLRINLKYLILLIVGIIVNLIFVKNIITIVIKLIPKYYYRYKDILRPGEGINLLLMLFLIFLTCFLLKKGKIKNKSEKIYFHMLGMAVYLQSLSPGFSLFTRLTEFFSISIIILIPNIISNEKNKYIRFIEIMITIIISIIYYKIILDKNIGKIIPYNFFWNT